jgi:hypothetical protein
VTLPNPSLPLVLLLLCGCSAGPASVSSAWDAAGHGVSLTFTTEGKNTFTAGGQSCTAKAERPCSVLLPAADLSSGWFDLDVETRRKTGMDEPLRARVFLGDDAFSADCEVVERRSALSTWEVRCTFPEGFSGQLAGRPMTGGRGTVDAAEVPLPEDGGVDRPLIKASLPLDVVNRAGATWPKALPVVVPVPLVQLRLAGWQDPWYDPKLPLSLLAEPGAQVVVNGQVVEGADGPKGAVHQVAIEAGVNRVDVEASRPGRTPARHSLLITSKAPDTPLYLETPRELAFTTTGSTLRVAGRSLPYAKIYVDTRRVPEVIDGRFDVEVPLVEGPNEIQVLAVVDGEPGVRKRPPTKLELHVDSQPNPEMEDAQQLAALDPRAQRAVLDAAADDPWSQTGQDVSFPLVVSSASRTPAGAGCQMRLEGLACSEEARREVQVGFQRTLAAACAGLEFPAVVEMDTCPKEVQKGSRIRVAGTIRGAVGGRWGVRTVERPRITATAWKTAPWVEELPDKDGL